MTGERVVSDLDAKLAGSRPANPLITNGLLAHGEALRMCNENEWIVREAFLAYDRGDFAHMMEFVDPDLQWTYFDPGLPDSPPQVCRGREELEKVLSRQATRGLRSELEEVVAAGDQVILVMRTPGLDQHRGRQTADDRTYDVVTVREGRIVELHACRDHSEARTLAGIG
jgi:ketosteroid isomerase-like protein